MHRRISDYSILNNLFINNSLGDLATAYGLTVYDVPYFHLARMIGVPIASRDRGIIAACKAWGVPHWQP